MEADLRGEFAKRFRPHRTRRFELDLRRGVAGKQGEQETASGETLREQVRTRPDSVIRGEESSNRSSRRYGQVAGGFVQAEGKPPSPRSDEVDLHIDRGRPGEALIQAEEHVRKYDPAPGRCEDD